MWERMGRSLLLLVPAAVMAACTSLPQVDREAITSEAIPLSTSTTLGRIAKSSQPAPDQSGFRLMPLGPFSLDTRIQLARRAEVSLDVQYYDFANDETGRWLMRALRDAALRGVRVRFLIDDFYTSGEDTLLLAFASYPNVEVRIFNPFCCAREQGQVERFLAETRNWAHVNHRMHNKLFVADGAMAVIGGRNVANEYFLRDESQNFVDLDAFTVGFIVPPLEGLFDRYWNSDPVYPLKAVTRTDLTTEQLHARFEEWTGPAATPPPPPLPPNDVLGYGPIADDLDLGRLGLIWGDAYVFADHPDKPFDSEAGADLLETSVTYNVFEAIRAARQEVVASSPYFVPGPTSMQMLRDLRAKNVTVKVLTNSLASTDEPAVSVGYARFRPELLGMGIDLYELSGTRLRQNKRLALFGKSLGRLHAKLVVIDRRKLFIGSMNLDPRSASINTELGAVIDSPQLARELLRVLNIDLLQNAYKVQIAPGGGLEWIGIDGDKQTVLTTEPDTTAWMRFKAWLLTPFVPDEQL